MRHLDPFLNENSSPVNKEEKTSNKVETSDNSQETKEKESKQSKEEKEKSDSMDVDNNVNVNDVSQKEKECLLTKLEYLSNEELVQV